MSEQNCIGDSPLHLAISRCHLGVVELLLKFGADTAKVNMYVDTGHGVFYHLRAPLSMFCLSFHTGFVALFRFADSPLHTAVRVGITEMVDMILPSTTCVNHANRLRLTALHLASQAGNHKVLIGCQHVFGCDFIVPQDLMLMLMLLLLLLLLLMARQLLSDTPHDFDCCSYSL